MAHPASEPDASRLRRVVANRRNQSIAAAVLLAGVIAGIVFGLGSSDHRQAANRRGTTTSTTASTVSTGPRCPLTDAPAPGVQSVPDRPALLVKIGNEPYGARPQSGLNEADLVFDTPAEGFIMRYVAVYQCRNASAIGPTRSVRWVDWNMIAPQFHRPILAFAGGINPNVDGVDADRGLIGANLLEGAQAAGHRIGSRVPPDNLYTSTAALYGLFPGEHGVPQPVFAFSSSLPQGSSPARSVAIGFSAGTDVLWRWDPHAHVWVHTYAGQTDIDAATGRPVTTINVVVQIVHYRIGPYCESGCPGGSGDIESDLLGSGAGYVLRDGRAFKVTWSRPMLSAKTTFTLANGHAVPLAPGRTWVELLPDNVAPPVVMP